MQENLGKHIYDNTSTVRAFMKMRFLLKVAILNKAQIKFLYLEDVSIKHYK